MWRVGAAEHRRHTQVGWRMAQLCTGFGEKVWEGCGTMGNDDYEGPGQRWLGGVQRPAARRVD